MATPEFTKERRAAISSEKPLGGYVPPGNALTTEELAHHIEVIVCAFFQWPGNSVSDAEMVYRVAFHALRTQHKVSTKQALITVRDQLKAVFNRSALLLSVGDIIENIEKVIDDINKDINGG